MQSPVKVCSDQTISAAAKYRVPQGANLVGWFNGRVAFFRAKDPDWWTKQRGRRYQYAKMPDDSNNWEISFPAYVCKDSGHFYGEPEWTSVRSFKSEDQTPMIIPL